MKPPITVTTMVYKEAQPPETWRVDRCAIDLGQDQPVILTSGWAYASAEAAHADMRMQAIARLKDLGIHVAPEQIRWRLHMIG